MGGFEEEIPSRLIGTIDLHALSIYFNKVARCRAVKGIVCRCNICRGAFRYHRFNRALE